MSVQAAASIMVASLLYSLQVNQVNTGRGVGPGAGIMLSFSEYNQNRTFVYLFDSSLLEEKNIHSVCTRFPANIGLSKGTDGY